MKRLRIGRKAAGLLVTLALGACLWSARAFPPAPHHVIHGVVRDEYGEPLVLTTAQILMETTNGTPVAAQLLPNVRPGENYVLTVPMDSFVAPDAYKPSAQRATVPFRLKVKLGGATYLPIEMAGNFASLGKPAAETQINLTLGVDSDGDGLPDAWENLLIAMLGGGLTLADIRPNGDNDGDGLNNLQEYITGTYAWDPSDGQGEGLRLGIVRREGQGPVLQFFGDAGRSYTVLGTTNLTSWTTMSVRVPPGNTSVPATQHYFNPASEILELEVVLPAAAPKAMFFRVQVD